MEDGATILGNAWERIAIGWGECPWTSHKNRPKSELSPTSPFT